MKRLFKNNGESPMNMKKIVTWLTAIMLISFGVAALCGPQKIMLSGNKADGKFQNVDIQKKCSLEGLKSIHLDAASAKINIIPSDEADVKVRLHGTSSSKEKPGLDFRNSNGDITAKVVTKPMIGIFLGSQSLQLDVSVPKQYAGDIKVGTVSGNIELGSFSFEKCKLNTTSGEISMNQVTAKEVEIGTVSGNVKSSGLFANKADFSTTSGELELESFTGALKFDSVSGDLNVGYKEFKEPAIVKTTSGKIAFKLPENSGLAVKYKSVSGEFNSDFPITVTQTEQKHDIQGNIANGGPELSVETISGDLEIKK